MSKRRSLTAGVNTIPDADPEAVRSFITQERKTTPEAEQELAVVAPSAAAVSKAVVSKPKKPKRGKTVTPVGLIPVTVRLRPELAGALKRASLERQLSGEEPNTQQDLVELVLEPWLSENGYV